MATLKIIGATLISAFILSCGVTSSPPQPATSSDESEIGLTPCEVRDGLACRVQGAAGRCDNGTDEGGRCLCFPFSTGLRLVCG